MKHIPSATYRIQFNPSFGFKDTQKIASYLKDLGITDLYASPIFRARKGSDHGYDVVDPNEINPELGGEAGFDALAGDLKNHGIGWLQDIVPNHMAFDCENQMLMDVLENGEASQYFRYFDIDWNHIYEGIKGRLLAPFLGRFYGECLNDGEIKIGYDENGFFVTYYELRFPLRTESYPEILNYNFGVLENALGKTNADLLKLVGIIHTFSSLPAGAKIPERHEQIKLTKKMLWNLYESNDSVKDFIGANIGIFNGKKGSPESFNMLDSLLLKELFRLSFWKVANEEINYRRFFNINSLISLRVEDENVFEECHRLILRLVEEGRVTGLRVDHVDGLYDPDNYLERIREKTEGAYLVVEKILDFREKLPTGWDVEGTTGYDFMNHCNSIFCVRKNERRFNKIYSKATGRKFTYEELAVEKKRLIIGRHMAGDIDNLAHIIKRVSGLDRDGRDITLYGLRRALVEVMAVFPVYRTYITREKRRKADMLVVRQAAERARKTNPGLLYELNFIEKFLLLEFEDYLNDEEKGLLVNFVMRLQQFTGPLMAKGVEDTLFYVFNRLISLNEVGGNPGIFGISGREFHDFNVRRARTFIHAMNATSTHDAKRGEDTRMRINVLTELPREWEINLKTWKKINKPRKIRVGKVLAPEDNDEYFFYQTLLGAYPFDDKDAGDFAGRMKDYMIKAVREAKVHTAWLKPDIDYENAFVSFIDDVLDPVKGGMFLNSFLPFQKKIAFYGIFNSLSQILLKIASPGVPDFYQGSELWDLSLVDPDNRRPVDFEKRSGFLKEMREKADQNAVGFIPELFNLKEDGRLKFFLTYKALHARKQNGDFFSLGDYIPLEVDGTFKNNIIAFARRHAGKSAIVIVPRFLSQVVSGDQLPLSGEVWGTTQVILPADADMPSKFGDAITGVAIESNGRISVGDALRYFPVSLLFGG